MRGRGLVGGAGDSGAGSALPSEGAARNTASAAGAGGVRSNPDAGFVLGYAEADAGALAGAAGDLQAVLGAVDAAQPLVHVHQAYAERRAAGTLQHLAHRVRVHAHAVVVHADPALVAAVLSGDDDAARPHLLADTVAH